MLTFFAIRFSERDFGKFPKSRYQLIVITPPNPSPQILSGEFSIHIKSSEADPLKNTEYICSDYGKKEGCLT